jgi:molybdopterin synthase catalytic subunit
VEGLPPDRAYDGSMDALAPPLDEDTWVGLSGETLPVAEAASWAVLPDCGGLVVFSGTSRNHAPGRPEVFSLEYEAYDDYVEPVLRSVADESRKRWPEVRRIVLLHRTGEVAIGDSAVVVAVSSPHREEAFAAARFCIDTLKRTAPIWKRERWAGGASWVRCDHELAQ